MTPVADKLDEDVGLLETKVDAASYQPAQLANGAVELLNEVSKSKITGEEERYSHTDLVDFQANVDGAKQAFVLLRPALDRRNPTLARTVASRFDGVDAALAPYRRGATFVDYSTVTPAQRAQAQPGRGRARRAALPGRRDDRRELMALTRRALLGAGAASGIAAAGVAGYEIGSSSSDERGGVAGPGGPVQRPPPGRDRHAGAGPPPLRRLRRRRRRRAEPCRSCCASGRPPPPA